MPALASSPESPSVRLSSSAAGASNVTYTVGLTTSSGGAIQAGGTITLYAAPGTLWPSGTGSYVLTDSTTSGGSFTNAQAVKFAEPGLPVFNFLNPSGSVVTITVPNAINSGDVLALTVAGVKNPGAGADALGIATSGNQDPASVPYAITASRAPLSPSVTVSSQAAGATNVTYTVALTTSASGAVPAGGTITLSAPPGTLWPSAACAYALTDSTTPSGGFSCAHAVGFGEPGLPVFNFLAASGDEVTITVPNDIHAGDALRLAISGVENPSTVSAALSISTSADPNVATAPITIVSPTSVSSPSVSPSSTGANATNVTYTVGLTATSALPAGSSITLAAPAGTLWGATSCDYSLTDSSTSSGSFSCAASAARTAAKSTVTITVPNDIHAGDALSLAAAGVTNPAGSSSPYAMRIHTSADPASAVANYSITGASASLTSVSSPSLGRTSSAAGANGLTYTIDFTTSAGGALTGGSSLITLAAPSGTLFGACPYGCGGGNATYTLTDLTNSSGSGATGPATFADGGAAVDVNVPNNVAAGDHLRLVITQVTNPPASTGTLAISTSADKAPVTVADTSTAAGTVSSTSLSTSSSNAGASGVSYTIGLTTSATGKLEGGLGAITLAGPPGTVFGACPYGCGGGNATYTITDSTTPSASGSASAASTTDNGAAVNVVVPKTINAGDQLQLVATQVTNSQVAAGNLTIATSSDKGRATVSDPTTAADSVQQPSLAMSSIAPGASAVSYTLDFTTGAHGTLLGGLGSISLRGLPGTAFSSGGTVAIADRTHSSGSGTASSLSVTGGGAELTFTVPNTIGPADELRVSITGVSNSPSGGGLTSVSTSSDAIPVAAFAVPVNVTATAGDSSAGLSWTAPPSTASPVTGYVVTPYIGGAAQTPIPFLSADTTETVLGLQNGSTYRFKVSAVTTDGTGPLSAASNPVTPGVQVHPTAGVSTHSLRFGDVRVTGTSQPQTVELANTGGGSLSVSSLRISGADAADFKLAADGCTGRSLAGGQRCTASVTFTPGARGSRSAQLSITDNAPDTRQTVSLSGTGSNELPLSGHVTFRGTAVGDAAVQVCGIGSGGCETATSAGDGSFTFELPAATTTYSLTAYSPPGGNTGQAQVSPLNLPAAGLTGIDVALPSPPGVPAGFTVLSAGGVDQSAGTRNPFVYWGADWSIRLDRGAFPTGGQIIVTQILLQGIDSSNGRRMTKVVNVGGTVHGGVPVGLPLGAGGLNVTLPALKPIHGQVSMQVAYQRIASGSLDTSGIAGTQILYEEYPPPDNTLQVVQPTDPLPAYFVNLNAPAGIVLGPGNITGADAQYFSVVSLTSYGVPPGTQDCGIGTAPLQLTPNFQSNPPAGSACGVAVQFTPPPLPEAHRIYYYATLVVPADSGGLKGEKTVSLVGCDLRVSGESAGLTGYDACGSSNGPDGPETEVEPPDGNPPPPPPPPPGPQPPPDPGPVPGPSPWSDPSGTVFARPRHGGLVPLAGATVTLSAGHRRVGPFAAVPSGSTVMSPANRRNPDATSALGSFGWDVLPGYYRVSAAHRGCTARAGGHKQVLTPTLTVPPPVFGLKLVLSCPHLTRTATSIELTARSAGKHATTLIASIHGHDVHGFVSFRANGRSLGGAPVDPRTRRATLTVAATKLKRLGGSYSGDASNAPSRIQH